jgi:energy-coupling factor transport system substrate-specific component
MAFLYPFFGSLATQVPMGQAHSQDAPFLTVALIALSLIALLVEVQGQAITAKTVAMLGVLIAITSVLRFIEAAIPMPGGFSPIFAPIILTGYVFGARFGFLMGAFTLLVSGLATGGVGPWLPFQMFTAGWVGLTAGLVSGIMPPRINDRFAEARTVGVLAVLGFVWGLLYGAIMNIYFWPYAMGPAEQTWAPGTGLIESLNHYAVFYLVTSLGWDLARAVGNVLLLLILGAPVIRALERFRRRFYYETHTFDS